MTRDAAGNIYVAGTTDSVDLPVNTLFTSPRDSNLHLLDVLRGTAEPLSSPLGQNILGFATTFANPNLVYATSGAGVMRSLDRGRTWEVVARRSGDQAIASIAIDPRNTDELYGGGSTGLVKSTDGGRTWFPSGEGLQVDKPPPWVSRIVPHPRRADVVLSIVLQATGLEGLLFRSDDGGAHWVRQPGLDLTMQVEFDPRRPGIVFATGRYKIYKSTDDGDSWSVIATIAEMGLPGPLVVDPIRAGTLYVTNGMALFRSSDDGATWQRLYSQGSLLFAGPSGNLYATGGGQLLLSRDAGTTWTRIPAPLGDRFALLSDGRILIGGRRKKDAFVAKFGSDGELVWATYLGGSDEDNAGLIAVDAAGQVYVAGMTASRDFPVTPGALAADSWPEYSDYRPFWAKIAADGQSLVYAMLFTRQSQISDIAVDSGGNVFFVGSTTAPIPTTPGVVWPDFDFTLDSTWQWTFPRPHAFAAKLDPSGATLLYATYLRSGTRNWARSIALDELGFAYVGGNALWKLAPDATRVAFTTTLGFITSLARSPDGLLHVTGQASGVDFWTSPGAFRQWPGIANRTAPFVAKFNSDGQAVASTALGSGESHSIAIAADGSVIVAGSTGLPDFPTRGLVETAGGGQLGWVARLNATLSDLPFGTYLGGQTSMGAAGAAPEGASNIVTVLTSGRDTETDVLLVRTEERQRGSAPRVDAVLNEASMLAGPVSSAERVLLTGAGFDSGVTVTFGDAAAEVLAVSDRAVVARAPALPPTGSVALRIAGEGGAAQPLDVAVTNHAPAFYTADGSGRGQALVLHEDASLNSAANPATRGSTVTLLVNGVAPADASSGTFTVPEPLQAHIAGALARTVQAEMLPAPGLSGAVLHLKVQVPELPDQALPASPTETGISLMVANRWTNQYPLTMWIK